MAPKKTLSSLASSPRIVLPGSDIGPFTAATEQKPAPSAKKITVSVIVKRKTPLTPANRLGTQRLTRAQFRQQHGADPAAVKLVLAFAKEFALEIVPDPASAARRTIQLNGTIDAMQKAFGS